MEKQTFYCRQYTMMGFLDSFAGFLSCVGGAFVAGAVQSLINQTTIPMTLILSKLFLGATYSRKQNLGAIVIVVGAIFSVMPSMIKKGGSHRSATTMTGVVVFILSVVPGAFSNVYKEYAFKTSENSVDIYYMTVWVTLFQVLTGLLFMPAQSIDALGGIPMDQMGKNLVDGNRCMMGYDSLPGDDCQGAGNILLIYVAINFAYNIFSLLVVKHGSASLSVISAAVALPLTNMSFSWKELMGVDYEPFDYLNVVSTFVVLFGFLIYSNGGKEDDDMADLWTPVTRRKEEKKIKGKILGLASAGGSTMYLRPRSDSDPTTPGYTPLMVQRINNLNQGGGRKDGGFFYYGSNGETEPLMIVGGTGGDNNGNGNSFEPSSV